MRILNDIIWERCNITFDFNKNKGITLINTKTQEKIIFEDNTFNITNINGTSILDGKYLLDGVSINSNLIEFLNDKSRVFKYRKGVYVLNITFEIDADMNVYLCASYLVKNYKYKKYFRLCEKNSLKGKIKIIIKIFGIFIINIIYKVLHLISNNKILFLTENSYKLSGNLEILYNKTDKKKKYFAKIKKEESLFDLFIEVVKIALAKTIVVDNYVSILNVIKLSKNTKVIQLWHAGVGYKSVGYMRFGLKGSPHPFVSCHRKYTYVVVDQENIVPVYQEVFGVTKDKIHPVGMPRIDEYLTKEHIEESLNKYSEFNDKKVVLFAPTYRGNGMGDAYYDYNNLDLDKLYKSCKENNIVFLIKMHPFIKDKIQIKKKYQDLIIDLSDDDINELLLISDVLVTDYSSCLYEFSLLNRPTILYRPDKEFYEAIRTIHKSDYVFKNTLEVLTFDALLKSIENAKKINKRNHDSINRESCKKIIEDNF